MHTTSRYARQPFTLTSWQRDEIIRPLFGTVHRDEELEEWVRRYRIAWIELARKNGKSELMAGIALYLLLADGEEGAEVYSAAKDTDQAARVFGVAKRMVELQPALKRRLKIYETNRRILDPRTGSYYKVLPADALGNLGENPHGILFDEIIAQPNRELWDALKTGFGVRSQPLLVAATNAGNDPTSFAAAEHRYCERVLESPEIDPARFVFMRNLPKDLDAFDERNWPRCNPAMTGPREERFLNVQVLRDEAREARENPAAENAFRQFRLSQWVQQTSRYMPLHVWDRSAGMVDESSLAGRRAWGGLDLSSSDDLTALALDLPVVDDAGGLDPERHEAIWRHWITEAVYPELVKRTGREAERWVREGFLTVTSGDVIDYSEIRAELERIVAPPPHGLGITIDELAYDRWGATQLAVELQDAGLRVFSYGQSIKDLSPPTKLWDRLVRAQGYIHGGNPVARWQVDNLVVRTDSSGNIKPDKEKSNEKIDGVVASIMALDRATLAAQKKPRRRSRMRTA